MNTTTQYTYRQTDSTDTHIEFTLYVGGTVLRVESIARQETQEWERMMAVFCWRRVSN